MMAPIEVCTENPREENHAVSGHTSLGAIIWNTFYLRATHINSFITSTVYELATLRMMAPIEVQGVMGTCIYNDGYI